jgi:hypothetical protein
MDTSLEAAVAADVGTDLGQDGSYQRLVTLTHEGDSHSGVVMIQHGERAGLSMAAAIELRDDLSGDDLRRLARGSRDGKQVSRLLALVVILDGGTRTEAARVGGVGLQIVRDWVLRFNAEGPAGLVDRKAPGNAPTLTAEQRATLAQVVEVGPEP